MGHCSTHTGSDDFQVSLIGGGGYAAVALKVNLSL